MIHSGPTRTFVVIVLMLAALAFLRDSDALGGDKGQASPASAVPTTLTALAGKWDVDKDWEIELAWDGQNFSLSEDWQGRHKHSSEWKRFDGCIAFRWDHDVFALKSGEKGTLLISQFHHIGDNVFTGGGALPKNADATAIATRKVIGAEVKGDIAASPTGEAITGGREVVIDAKNGASSSRISLGPIKHGQSVTFQYLRGQWTAFPGKDFPPGSPDDSPVAHYNVLPLQLCEKKGAQVTPLAVVPGGTKLQPYSYTADHDVADLVLNNSDTRPSNNIGEVVYMVAINTSPLKKSASDPATMPVTVASESANKTATPTADNSGTKNVTTAAPANATAATTKPVTDVAAIDVSPQEVAEFRQKSLQSIREEIKKVESLIAMLPNDSSHPERHAGGALADRLENAKEMESQVLALNDSFIAQEIHDLRVRAAALAEQKRLAAEQAKKDAEQAARQQELIRQQGAQAASQHLASVRARKWPNWNGPWKTCPYCGGTCRDADAEREANTLRGGVIGSSMVGSGQFHKEAGAVIPCPVCGGTGSVPDEGQ